MIFGIASPFHSAAHHSPSTFCFALSAIACRRRMLVKDFGLASPFCFGVRPFSYRPCSSQALSFHPGLFHPRPFSSQAIFIPGHFHLRPFSSPTLKQPLRGKVPFHPQCFVEKYLFILPLFIPDPFHPRPFSSPILRHTFSTSRQSVPSM